MDFFEWIELISRRLENPLPGKDAHILMAPQPVDLKRFEDKFRENHRKSGVLLLFYPEDGNVIFPLIKRPEYPGVHSGQIALPGGKMEPEDLNLIQTALREAEEEIGVKKDSVQILGQMTDLYIPTSNFLVSPVVGFLPEKPKLVPDQYEVSRIIPTNLSSLQDETIRRKTKLKLSNGFVLDTPYFEIDGEMVWGATAMILSELAFLLSMEEG